MCVCIYVCVVYVCVGVFMWLCVCVDICMCLYVFVLFFMCTRLAVCVFLFVGVLRFFVWVLISWERYVRMRDLFCIVFLSSRLSVLSLAGSSVYCCGVLASLSAWRKDVGV